MKHKYHHHHGGPTWWFIIIGVVSALWFIIRTGRKPSRIVYPCQQVALTNSLALFGWLGALVGGHFLYRKLRHTKIKPVLFLGVSLLVFSGIFGFRYWQQITRPKTAAGQSCSTYYQGKSGSSRVVWVQNSAATSGRSYSSSWANKADQTTVNQMLSSAMLSLTNQTTVSSAWTKIFQDHNGGADYVAGEKIAIKVNFNNYWDCDGNGCPTLQVITALLKQLTDPAPNGKGIAQNNIWVYDASRSFPDYFVSLYPQSLHNAFPQVQLEPLPDCWSSATVQGANIWCGLDNQSGHAKYLINMPLLRTHGYAGVTLSFKNHLGSTNAPANFHSSLSTIRELNENSFIRNKTMLIVDDGLYGLNSGGPDGFPNITPNSIFVSADTVAIDSVMTDYLISAEANVWQDPQCNIYYPAAQHGVGNYATSCNGSSCTFNYKYNNNTVVPIDLVRCNPNCPNQPPVSPAPSPSGVPSPSPSASPTPTPAASATPAPSGNYTNVFLDTFDPVVGQWTHSATQGSDDWQLSTSRYHSSSHSYWANDPIVITDKNLRLVAFTVPASGRFTFWHTYNFEAGCDGGVIEISTNGGSSFSDLGANITSGGYSNGLTCSTNPIVGRQAWTGGSLGSMNQTIVDLSSYTGQSVIIRFRLVADDGTGGGGWYIDDVAVQGIVAPKGDINGDHTVNATDLKLLISNFLGAVTCQTFSCDVNGDNKVSLLDAVYVIKDFGASW